MTSKIAIVGEAWGQTEDQLKHPFVGASGHLLWSMLSSVGIVSGSPRGPMALRNAWLSSSLLLTNILQFRPPKNDLEALCVSRAEVGPSYPYRPVRAGKYLPPSVIDPEMARLKAELERFNPNLILALGGTASCFLLNNPAISKIRGTLDLAFGRWKCLPTFHPAAIIREWSLFTIDLADMIKAKREAEFPELRYTRREIWTSPTVQDVEDFYARYIFNQDVVLAVDIETTKSQIDCIGIAPSAEVALVVPFIDRRKSDWSYWTRDEEKAVRALLRRILSGQWPKVFHNGVFDLQWLWKVWGMPVKNAREDTMILHHALFAEMPKALGFLGSIYSSERAWKLLGRRKSEKREDVA